MKHLQSYNEELFNIFRRRGKKSPLRGVKKDDLYISSNIGYKKRIGPSKITDDNTFITIYFPEIKLSFIKEHIVKKSDLNWDGKGVFGDFGSYHWDPYGFKSAKQLGSTSVWYDVGDLFINLRNISKELGYDINQKVYVKSTEKDSKITEIVNVAFYNYSKGMTHTINECFTLLYKVEGDDLYYQIGQLELIEGESNKNIVDSVIEENFFELIDENLIEFSSKEFTKKGKVSYECLVKVSKDMTPEVLFKISECLLVASRRLNDMGIFIDIESMKHSEGNSGTGTTDIVFLAIQKDQVQ
jgi:hypothetical protein